MEFIQGMHFKTKNDKYKPLRIMAIVEGYVVYKYEEGHPFIVKPADLISMLKSCRYVAYYPLEDSSTSIITANPAVATIALQAMERALMVGEIHFETNTLAREVKKNLLHAINLLKH